jgi:hypothetical protein
MRGLQCGCAVGVVASFVYGSRNPGRSRIRNLEPKNSLILNHDWIIIYGRRSGMRRVFETCLVRLIDSNGHNCEMSIEYNVQFHDNVNQLNGSWQSDNDTPYRRRMIQHL